MIHESTQLIDGKPYTVRIDTGKRLWAAYAWWATLGILGAHRYYLRRYPSAVLYSFTAGVFGVGWLLDFLNIPSMVKGYNMEVNADISRRS